MPIHFQLKERLAGFALNAAAGGQEVQLLYKELIAPTDALHLLNRLDKLQGCLFSKIPGLPPPSLIDHLLVVIGQDLAGTAYVNELNIIAKIKPARDIAAGTPVYLSDVADISSIDLGVEVPTSAAVVVVRSFGWKRSLFFDFGPLQPEIGPRDYPLDRVLAQQALLLLGLPPSSPGESGTGISVTRVEKMAEGLESLKQLLRDRCEEERVYQELVKEHPWMLGGFYVQVERHTTMDDSNIPDFTAVRCYDGFHDIIELKQPFLKLFRTSGGFSAAFNDAWNQAERYLAFANRQRSYLREEKELRFENSRCFLILGYRLTEKELQEIRSKESVARSISVFTYDHILETAEHILGLMRTAGERIVPGTA